MVVKMVRKTAVMIAVVMTALQLLWGQEMNIQFESSYDGSEQSAAVYVPEDVAGRKVPLVVVAHSLGCTEDQAENLGWYELAEKEKFIVICPKLHGLNTAGETSMGAIPAQRDILDAIEYAKNHYSIDETRIYLVGRSMGGMLAMLTALKYPDRFAAVVAGQGIYDLELFMKNAPEALREAAYPELGGPEADGNRWEYRRRSAYRYARNSRYVPIMMWHGTNDTFVAPEQSKLMFEAMEEANEYQRPVAWRVGSSHCELNYPPEWAWNQMKTYENVCENCFDVPHRFFSELDYITDEDVTVFYATIELKEPERFGELRVMLRKGELIVRGKNLKKVTINGEKIPATWVTKVKGDGVEVEWINPR